MPGQVNRDSPFGAKIYELARDPKYKTFLDLGTWNGEGTTKCLYDAVADRDAMIYSVEANPTMYRHAQAFWAHFPLHYYKLTLLHGTLTKGILTKEEIMADPMFQFIRPHYDLHYVQDCIDTITAPVVTLPAQIDFAVLDGGEFNGKNDFQAVMKLKPKVICLDDINVMKNYHAYNHLKGRSDWVEIVRGSDRNGWAIFLSDPHV